MTQAASVTIENLQSAYDGTITYNTTDVDNAADAAAVTIKGANEGAILTFDGDVEAMTFNVTAETTLTNLVLDAKTTSVTLNASFDLNVVAEFNADGATTLTIMGAGDVDLTGATDVDLAALTTVSAGTATGDISLFINDAEDHTITTGAGDDTVDMDATLNSDDTVNLGAGSNTLRIDADGLSAGITDLTITNVQTFRFDNMAGNSGAINMDNLTPTSIRLDAAQAASQAATVGVLTLTDLTSAVTSFSLIGAGAAGAASDDLAFNGLTIDYDVTTDVSAVTVIVNNGGTVADDVFVGALDMNNVDALVVQATNIGQATADELTIANINGDALETITIVADGEVIITDIDSGDDDVLEVLDLSGVTAGGVTVSDISGHAASFTITGSGFDDDITNGVTAVANTITVDLGAGNDRYVSNDGADIITTGTGVDTIVFQGDATDDLNIIRDFTAGAGGDVIGFVTSVASNGSTGPTDMTLTRFDTGQDDLAYDSGFTVFSGVDAASLSTADVAARLADTDGAGGGAIVSNDTETDELAYIAVSDGTDTGIYLITNDTGTTAILAAELTLLVTLEGVGDATDLTAANFANFI